MLALLTYATGSFTLHRVLRARAEVRQVFFFCCIPFLLNPSGFWRDYRTIHDWGAPLPRWPLPAEDSERKRCARRETRQEECCLVVAFCFCLFTYFKSAGRRLARFSACQRCTLHLGCALASDVVATFLRLFLFGLPYQIPRYITHTIFITFLLLSFKFPRFDQRSTSPLSENVHFN